MFQSFTGLFLAFRKFHTYSTNLHTQGHKSSWKDFSRNFTVFQENLHCVQNWDRKDLAGILKCYPLIMWQSIKISVLFHKSTHQPLPFWLQIISGKFPSFPGKLTLCAKLVQKWSSSDFEVLPPDYVTINQNLRPIPEIYIPSTTILTKNNFWKISQFSRKTYIVCKIGTKNGLAGILKCYLLIMWQSIKLSVLFHKFTHQPLPFWLQIISGKFPSFPGKLTLCAKLGQKR